GSRLTQEFVAGTATDDVDLRWRSPCNAGKQVDRVAVLESEALDDAPDDRARAIWLRLPRAQTDLTDALGHGARLHEARVIRVYQGDVRGGVLRETHELVEVEGGALGGPRLLTLVHEPHPVDVLEQADG